MAGSVEELLDMLFEMIDNARNATFGRDRCVIERDQALDLIDDIRSQFPIELSEARKVMSTRTELIAAARREAEAIRKSAEDKARQILAEDVISRQAKQRAAEMIQQAEERCRELKRSANEYCEDALRRTEEAVAEAYSEIKKSRSRFRAASGAAASPPAGPNARPIYDAAADED